MVSKKEEHHVAQVWSDNYNAFRRFDPRIDRTKLHSLAAIIVIAICAIICGADDWVAVAAWSNAKRKWLEKFLDLLNGITSPDTFGRVFASSNPQ